ncbi:MAG: hypothetical protein ACKOX3_04610 [Bacteroidota bacterium]
MKKLVVFGFFLVGGWLSTAYLQEDNLAKYVLKYNSEWGKTCLQCMESKGTYRIYLKNTYNDKLDLKVGVQEKDLRWRIFQRLNFAPNDTMVAYACKGTGKYMVWAKLSSDTSTELPTDAVINAQTVK